MKDDVVEHNEWLCKDCLSEALPFYFYDDDDDFQNALNSFIYDKDLDIASLKKSEFNPFEWNTKCTVPLFDIDPDIQYFAEPHFSNQSPCEYLLEDEFADRCNSHNEIDKGLSLLCYNIRSLPKKFSEFQILLESLKHNFDIIGLTETWLSPLNFDLYSLEGYQKPVQKYRSSKRGGGIMLYIKNTVQYKIRQDLAIDHPLIEICIIEVESGSLNVCKNVIVGIIYRVPDSDVEIFNNEFTNILEKINKENKTI